MSQRYVELYEKFKECDSIAIIGYGFNGDDGHINGMFRSLIEEEQKYSYFSLFLKKLSPPNIKTEYKKIKNRFNTKFTCTLN